MKPRARDALLRLSDWLLPLSVAGLCLAAAVAWRLWPCRGWPSGDPANHLLSSLELHQQPEPALLLLQTYPPLVYLWSQPLYLLAGAGRFAGELSVALLLVPLALVVHRLGLHWGGRRGALLAVVLVCFNREVFRLCTVYMLDLPMTTLLGAGLLCLIRSDLLRERNYSILFGLSLAGGLLCHYSFAFYAVPLLALCGVWILGRGGSRLGHGAAALAAVAALAGGLFWLGGHAPGLLTRLHHRPLLALWTVPVVSALLLLVWFAGPGGKPGRDPGGASERGPRLANLGLAGLTALLPSLPWYLVNLPLLLEYRQHMMGRSAAGVGHAGASSAMALASQLPHLALGFCPMLAAGLAVALLHRGEGRAWRRLLLLSGGVSSLLVLLIVDAQARFLVPLLPLVVPVACCWADRLGPVSGVMTAAALALQLLLLVPANDPGVPLGLVAGPGELRRGEPDREQAERRSCRVARNLDRLVAELERRRARRVALVFTSAEESLAFWRQDRFAGVDHRVLRHLLADSTEQVVLLHREGGELRSWERDTPRDETLRPGDFLLLMCRRRWTDSEAREAVGSPPLPPARELADLGYFELEDGRGMRLLRWKAGPAGRAFSPDPRSRR